MRVTPDLVPVHTFSIRSDTLVSRDPDIAFDGEKYTVVWSEGPFPGEYRVMATTVSTTGTVSDSVVLFGMDAYQEFHPAIDFDGTRYLTVWHNYNYPPYGVYGRFLTTGCQPQGREFPIRQTEVSFWCKPDCAYGFDQYFVVWNEMTGGGAINIYGQIVTLDGFPAGGVIPIAEGADMQLYPRIGVGDSGYLVVWEEEGLICGQAVSASGTLTGENFIISDQLVCSRGRPGIAFCENGCMVVWMEFHSDNYDIFGDGNFSTAIDTGEQPVIPAPVGPAVLYSMSSFSLDAGETLYDSAGRRVGSKPCMPGVYFIVRADAGVRKIVLIR